jgi:exodeoxyribonuclease VII small subunit
MSNNGSSSKSAHGESGDSFEDSFRRLQEVVRRLSEGSLTLQDALASFEEGMRLADRCSTMLDEAELRVKQVSERATQEGAASLASLDPTGAKPATGLTLVEVEHIEAAVLIEEDAGQRPERPASGGPAQRPGGTMHELDPLFDEDD